MFDRYETDGESYDIAIYKYPYLECEVLNNYDLTWLLINHPEVIGGEGLTAEEANELLKEIHGEKSE